MKRVLALSLLFVLLAVPASAETEKDVEKALHFERFYAYAIQSFGWKCNGIQGFDLGSMPVGSIAIPLPYYTLKITCENNLVYFARETGEALKRVVTICHKGTCKRFQ